MIYKETNDMTTLLPNISASTYREHLEGKAQLFDFWVIDGGEFGRRLASHFL